MDDLLEIQWKSEKAKGRWPFRFVFTRSRRKGGIPALPPPDMAAFDS